MSVSTSIRVRYGSREYIQIGFDIPKDCLDMDELANIANNAVHNTIKELSDTSFLKCFAPNCTNRAIGHSVQVRVSKFAAGVFCSYDCLDKVNKRLKERLK